MRWLALEHLAAAAFPDKFSVAHLYIAAHRYHRWAALDRHSFETIVVRVRVLRFGRDRTAVIRIVNHQVRITANRNRSFSRKKSKKFRSTSAGCVHEAVQTQPSAFHSVRVQQIDALFDSRNAVGNIDERILAEKLLLGVKRAMIRPDGVDRAGSQSLP